MSKTYSQPTSRYLTATQFSQLYGYAYTTIMKLLKNGGLQGFQIGGKTARWQILDPGYEYAVKMKAGPMVLARDIPMYRRSEVAQLINKSPYTITDWIQSGKIEGVKIGPFHFFSIADIERALAKRLTKKLHRYGFQIPRPELIAWGKKELAKGPFPLPPNPLDKVDP